MVARAPPSVDRKQRKTEPRGRSISAQAEQEDVKESTTSRRDAKAQRKAECNSFGLFAALCGFAPLRETFYLRTNFFTPSARPGLRHIVDFFYRALKGCIRMNQDVWSMFENSWIPDGQSRRARFLKDSYSPLALRRLMRTNLRSPLLDSPLREVPLIALGVARGWVSTAFQACRV